MKKKIFVSVVILFYIVSIMLASSAISLTIDDMKVKPGEEFTIKLKTDEGIVLGNSHISFNKDLFSFIGTEQANLTSNEIEPGEVAWMYTDLNQNTEGTKTLEFKFKAKEDVSKTEEASFKISDLTFVTNENEYSEKDIKGIKEFKVTISNSSGNNLNTIVILVLVVAIVLIIFNKYQK